MIQASQTLSHNFKNVIDLFNSYLLLVIKINKLLMQLLLIKVSLFLLIHKVISICNLNCKVISKLIVKVIINFLNKILLKIKNLMLTRIIKIYK